VKTFGPRGVQVTGRGRVASENLIFTAQNLIFTAQSDQMGIQHGHTFGRKI
jgi:hypothetical protein